MKLNSDYPNKNEKLRKRSSSFNLNFEYKKFYSFNKAEDETESSYSKSHNSEKEQMNNQMINKHLLEETEENSDPEADNFYHLYRKLSNFNDDSSKSFHIKESDEAKY